MDKKFLIEVKTMEVRDENGHLIALFRKPSGLMEDDKGKYIISKETGEKIYFEYNNSDEELPPPPKADGKNE